MLYLISVKFWKSLWKISISEYKYIVEYHKCFWEWKIHKYTEKISQIFERKNMHFEQKKFSIVRFT